MADGFAHGPLWGEPFGGSIHPREPEFLKAPYPDISKFPTMMPEKAATSSLSYDKMLGYFSLMGSTTAATGAVNQAFQEQAQSKYQANQLYFNSMMADLAARYARERGTKKGILVGRTAKKIKGAQKAAIAAQGLDPSIGSAAELIKETDVEAMHDIIEIENNAWREAWGYKMRSTELSSRAKMIEDLAGTRMLTTLLGGGIQALQYGAMASYYFGGA